MSFSEWGRRALLREGEAGRNRAANSQLTTALGTITGWILKLGERQSRGGVKDHTTYTAVAPDFYTVTWVAAVRWLSGKKNPHKTIFNRNIVSTWLYYSAFAETCSHKHNPWNKTIITFSFSLRKCQISYFCYKLPHSQHNPAVAAVRPVLTGARDGDMRSPRHRRADGFGWGTVAPQHVWAAGAGWQGRGSPRAPRATATPSPSAPRWRTRTGTARGKARAHALGDSHTDDSQAGRCNLLHLPPRPACRSARAREVTGSREILPSAGRETLLPVVMGVLCFLAPSGQTFAGSRLPRLSVRRGNKSCTPVGRQRCLKQGLQLPAPTGPHLWHGVWDGVLTAPPGVTSAARAAHHRHPTLQPRGRQSPPDIRKTHNWAQGFVGWRRGERRGKITRKCHRSILKHFVYIKFTLL